MTANASDDGPSIPDQEGGRDRIDLRTGDKTEILFTAAQQIPCPIDALSVLCRSDDIRPVLESRFGQELDIDDDGAVELAPNACSYVLSGSKPYIESAQQALDEGKRYTSEEEYEAATEQFRQAVALLEGIAAAFEAIEQEPPKLETALQSAKEHHDRVVKRAAKASIESQVRRANAVDSSEKEGGKQPSAPNGGKAEAIEAISAAIDTAQRCNESLLLDDSDGLSIDDLQQRRQAIQERDGPAKNTTDEGSLDSPPADSSGVSSEIETGGQNSAPVEEGPTRTELREELDRLTDELGKVPKPAEMADRGDYDPAKYSAEFGGWKQAVAAADVDIRQDLCEDLASVATKLEKRPTTSDVDRHGRYAPHRFYQYFDSWEAALDAAAVDQRSREQMIEELQRLEDRAEVVAPTVMEENGVFSVNSYRSEFGSWSDALGAANIDLETKLIEDLQRVGKVVGEPPRPSQMQEHGRYEASTISDAFGTWREALEAADLSEARTDQPETTSGSHERTPDRLSESAYETDWESIPNNARLERQLLVKVTGLQDPPGDRKAAIVEVVDRNGKAFELEIWETHDVDADWTVGEWYALENSRGKVWDGDGGVLSKRLSSTSALEILPFGADQPAVGDTANRSVARDSQTDVSGSTSMDSGDSTETTGENARAGGKSGTDDGGIFDDIMSDFEEL